MSPSTTRSWTERTAASAAASVLLWISRTLLSLAVVSPLLLAIQESGLASGPAGDAELFQPGSLLLLELLRVAMPLLAAGFRTALPLALLAAVCELLPLAFALDLLSSPGRAFGERAERARRMFPAFLALSAVTLLAQAALLLGSSLLGATLKASLPGGDARWPSLVPFALAGLALLACAGLGSVLDVARAAVVRGPFAARRALHEALLCLRERPWAVLLGAFPSVAGAALAYSSAAWVMTRLDVSSDARLPVALAFGTHQLAALFAIGCRVRWLSRALELCAETHAESNLR